MIVSQPRWWRWSQQGSSTPASWRDGTVSRWRRSGEDGSSPRAGKWGTCQNAHAAWGGLLVRGDQRHYLSTAPLRQRNDPVAAADGRREAVVGWTSGRLA